MASIFEGQPRQNKAEIPSKIGVIWVKGIWLYDYIYNSCKLVGIFVL